MNLHVWGLGYAGTVCAASLAQRGHNVVGVDIDSEKVARLNAGEAYFREPGLAARVAAVVADGRLHAVAPHELDGSESEASIVCVATPADERGTLCADDVLIAAAAIAQRMRRSSRFETVVVRSTVPVHFTRDKLRPLLEAKTGRKAGREFGVAMVPEFLREGHALADFDQPSLVVMGADDDASAEILRPLFASETCPSLRVPTATAELFKLVNNAFHALKIGFANETARLAHAHQVDGHAILRLLCEDRILNMSSAYLTPGFAFGGACVPKDLAALQALSPSGESPILAAIAASNAVHLDTCLREIRARVWTRIGLYGITNKAGSDDLRNSPVLALLDRMCAPPDTVYVYDPDMSIVDGDRLRARYGVMLVRDLAALQKNVDLIVNFRHAPLSLPENFPQLHFASFWNGAR